MNNSLSTALSEQDNNSLANCFTRLKTSRAQLISLIEDLPIQAFTWQPILTAQNIGTQLLHIAYTEAFFLGQDVPAEAKAYLWDDSKAEPVLHLPTKPLRWYLDLLSTVRYSATEKLKGLSGEDSISLAIDNKAKSLSISEVLWHLIEHEAHHRGQIALLKNWYQKAYTPVYA